MKKPKIIEGFSCVQMQREIRERISDEIKDNSDAFFRDLEKEFSHLPKVNRYSGVGLD